MSPEYNRFILLSRRLTGTPVHRYQISASRGSSVSGLANFSVKINILGVRGHMASVSTLVGVQKVHREPVSGRPWVFSEETGREFSLCTIVSQLALFS